MKSDLTSRLSSLKTLFWGRLTRKVITRNHALIEFIDKKGEVVGAWVRQNLSMFEKVF